MSIERPERPGGRAITPSAAGESVRVAVSTRSDASGAIAEVLSDLGPREDVGFLLLFVSARYDPQAIAEALRRLAPDLPHAACSTAGEIAFEGPIDGSIVAVGFLASVFTVAAAPLRDLAGFGFEVGGEVVSGLRRQLAAAERGGEGELFALTLLDGLCRREEAVLSALQRVLRDVPMVGGSCGDGLAFERTFVVCDGEPLHGAGLLLLVRTRRPFRAFKSDHFEPTRRRLVVTACDPDERLVTELDAEPARTAFAAAAGVTPEDLGGSAFAAHPLLVRVGGDYYCRSIQKMNDDGSLSFYCAIDTGVVLTVADTRDMVAALDETLTGLDDELGGLDFVLGFDCIHRRLEAESRGILPAISAVFRRHRVIGFDTYGEQFDAMHLNHTFTGIAFGRERTP